MAVAIKRNNSGLLKFYHFTSDPASDFTKYEIVAPTVWSQAGSLWFQTQTGFDAIQRRNSLTTAACVTVRARPDSDFSFPLPMCFVNDSPDDAGQLSGYRIYGQVGSTTLILSKRYGGASSTLSSTTIAALVKGTYYLLRVYVDSGTIYGKFGTTAFTKELSGSDGDMTSGSAALRAGHANTFDWFDIRTSHKVVMTALPSGYYLKVSDGTTAAKAAESSGTATVDAGAVLFPLASVSVYDGDPDSGGSLVCDLDTGDYADMGGGDEYTYVTIVDKEFTADSYVKATTLKTFLSDAYIKSTSEETITVDSFVAERLVKELSLDGYISVPNYVNITVDGYVLGTVEFVFTVDGIIAGAYLTRTYPILPTYRNYPSLLREYPT